MKLRSLLPLAIVLALAPPAAAAQSVQLKAYPETRWEQLVPGGWNPTHVPGGADVASLKDNDPKAAALLRRLREAWDKAPVRSDIDGRRLRIAGYVVPLETGKAGLTDFLLVPHFGACIHTPPPPANQIVRVTLRQPLKDVRSMDAVWVAGTLKAVRDDSDLGVSGYRLQPDLVEAYASAR